MKKLNYLLLAVLSLLTAFYFFNGRDYIKGEEWHYLGESEINNEQYLYMATNDIRGPYYISRLEELDNGNIQIEYDFYSDIEFDFLAKKPFSYFDTRIIYILFTSNGYGWILSVALILIAIIIMKNQRKAEIIIQNIAWHIFHPLMIFRRREKGKVLINKPDIRNEITIKDIDGIIGARSWKYHMGFLYSTGIGKLCWKSQVEYSDVIPSEDNSNGIYSFDILTPNLLLGNSFFANEIIGIVMSKGHWIEHEDGVVRSEYCQILHLILADPKKAGILSCKYGVPVTISQKPIQAYYKWLFSEEGYMYARKKYEIMEKTENGK